MEKEDKWYVCKYETDGVSGKTGAGEFESIEKAEKYARGEAKEEAEYLASKADVECREATPEEIGRAKKGEELMFKALRERGEIQ